jgi:hypothetical protein
MKRHIIIVILSLVICFSTFGHSGRTDKNGGHYNRKTGEYHYHNRSGSGLFWVIIIGGIIVFLIKSSGRNKNKK